MSVPARTALLLALAAAVVLAVCAAAGLTPAVHDRHPYVTTDVPGFCARPIAAVRLLHAPTAGWGTRCPARGTTVAV